MNPVVSVIMPVRNGGVYLAEAVASILEQSFQSLELLLVDDHSSDGALACLEAGDPRLVLLRNKGDGVSAAFNTGLTRARSDFIARMDADDIALPERIERQLEYLDAHPEVDICGARVEIFSGDELAGGNIRYQAWLNACCSPGAIRRELFVESPIPNPTALFRREAILKLGGYADPAWPEDYDLYLRADALGLRMGKPQEVLLRWRDHDGRLTRSDARYDLTRFQAAKAHYLAAHRLVGKGPVIIWGAGPSGRLMHDLLVAEGVAIQGFLEVHPRRIGGTKRDLPVWAIDHITKADESFVLVAVGAAGARAEIRKFMQGHGKLEGEQYLFVA